MAPVKDEIVAAFYDCDEAMTVAEEMFQRLESLGAFDSDDVLKRAYEHLTHAHDRLRESAEGRGL